jgi:hypothetical protein
MSSSQFLLKSFLFSSSPRFRPSAALVRSYSAKARAKTPNQQPTKDQPQAEGKLSDAFQDQPDPKDTDFAEEADGREHANILKHMRPNEPCFGIDAPGYEEIEKMDEANRSKSSK